jgi:hypothetical protein
VPALSGKQQCAENMDKCLGENKKETIYVYTKRRRQQDIE